MFLGAAVIVIIAVLVVQNFRDGATDDQVSSTQTQQATSNTHTVAEGETLWSIAEAKLGSGFRWEEISLANNIDNPSIIETGEKIIIPNDDTESAQSTQSTSASSDETYTVVRGDSLWEIAEEHYGDGHVWTEIAEANSLANPHLIHAGNVLNLPRG